MKKIKQYDILENVNGYIHVVDVTILARNVWRGMQLNETRPNYEYFMMQRIKNKRNPFDYTSMDQRVGILNQKNTILTVAANEGEKTVQFLNQQDYSEVI